MTEPVSPIIEWTDPPPKPAKEARPPRESLYRRMFAALLEQPGRWAKVMVAKNPQGIYVALRREYGKDWKLRFQVQSAKLDDGQVHVWARALETEPEPVPTEPDPDELMAQMQEAQAEIEAEAAAFQATADQEVPLEEAVTEAAASELDW